MLWNCLRDLYTFLYRAIAYPHWHVWECFLQCRSNSRKRAPETSILILITRLTLRITRTKHAKQWKLCQHYFVLVLQQIHSSCKQRDISLWPTEIPRLLTSPPLDAYKSLAPPKTGWDLDKNDKLLLSKFGWKSLFLWHRLNILWASKPFCCCCSFEIFLVGSYLPERGPAVCQTSCMKEYQLQTLHFLEDILIPSSW